MSPYVKKVTLLFGVILIFSGFACRLPEMMETSVPTPVSILIENSPVPTSQRSANLQTDNRPTNTAAVRAARATSPPEELAWACEDVECLSKGVKFNYLIVTRPLFVSALGDFVKWKQKQGYQVGLARVEWLNDQFKGKHLAEKIKNGLHTLRRQTGVEYVLLVGDTAIEDHQYQVDAVLTSYDLDIPWNVPVGYYRRLAVDPPGEVLPSDAYYVEDRDWDDDHNNLNAVPDQKNGEGRLDASLFLGRWPVRQADEIKAIVNKTMAVSPSRSIWFTGDSSLSGGAVSPCKQYPPASKNDYFYCYLDTYGIGLNQFFKENAPWLSTEVNVVNTSQPAEVKRLLSKLLVYQGVIVASYHGDVNCWALSANDCKKAVDLPFTQIFPLLEIESCSVSSFYFRNIESFSEALLKQKMGPAVITQAPASVPFLQALRAGEPVGKALWRSGSDFVYWPNPMGLLGDPSLIILVKP